MRFVFDLFVFFCFVLLRFNGVEVGKCGTIRS